MKKLWILPIAAMTMVACGGGEAANQENEEVAQGQNQARCGVGGV